MMPIFVIAASLALSLALGTAEAREPSTPAAMPGGATIGVPVGANLPRGLCFASRSKLFYGDIYDGAGTNLPVPLDVFWMLQANSFEAGSEILVNTTALKAVANNQSIGVVGYYRQQLTKDKLAGAVFGTGNRSQAFALGIGYSKRFRPSEVNLNAMREVSAMNAAGGAKAQSNFFTPIKV